MGHSHSTLLPIPRSRVVETIQARIRDSILAGDLKPGQKLPSEQELADLLGVGRGSVREAMKMLAAMSVVEVRQGDGTYVASAASSHLVDPLVFAILLQSGTSKDLLELRAMIMVGYCQLAAAKAQPNDFSDLETLLKEWDEYGHSPGAELQRLTQMDLEFHHKIIAIARNSLVARIALTVEDLFFASIRGSLNEIGGFERASGGHLKVLRALQKRDPAEIFQAVNKSLDHWHEHLEKDRSRHHLERERGG